jgi:26S proteasome regulatory subunit N2
MVIDTNPSEPKTLLELKAKTKATKPAVASEETLDDRINAAWDAREGRPESERTRFLREQAAGLAGLSTAGGGAAAAAGVLTAVDEDEEGAEEAEVPREFEYHSDDDGDAE